MADWLGRWDLTVGEGERTYPSWVELTVDGGSFVGEVGSARPVRSVEATGDGVVWSLPKQYEGRSSDLRFAARVEGGRLVGTSLADDGTTLVPFVGERAPALPSRPVSVGDSVDLVLLGKAGWRARWADKPDHWSETADGLENAAVGTDLVSLETFADFELTAEYRYPAGSNSGIYLRGRYEFQVLDDHGDAPHVGGSAAIYGFLAPSSNPIRPAGEWNTAVIRLVGRHVTITLNGETVTDAEIPGITGGALDSAEGEPGPILIQGDHGPVTYRKLEVVRLTD